METDEKVAYLREWAGKQQCRLVLDGEVGFGHPCVGVLYGSTYVDTPGSGYNHHGPFWPGDPAGPPDDVGAYHKHDCLAVLGQGDEAIDGLYRWVQRMDAEDVSVAFTGRDLQPNPFSDPLIEAALKGTTQAMACVPIKRVSGIYPAEASR